MVSGGCKVMPPVVDRFIDLRRRSKLKSLILPHAKQASPIMQTRPGIPMPMMIPYLTPRGIPTHQMPVNINVCIYLYENSSV